jgi:large subunit ribosomal protein L29
MPLKPSELRHSSAEELRVKIQNLRRELLDLRVQSARAPLANSRQIRNLRRDLARALTVYKQLSGGSR